MKILADENLVRPIVDWLRQLGHDVEWVAESSPGISDEAILNLANQLDRILVTADRDFGDLVYFKKCPRLASCFFDIGLDLLKDCSFDPAKPGHWWRGRYQAISSWRIMQEFARAPFRRQKSNHE